MNGWESVSIHLLQPHCFVLGQTKDELIYPLLLLKEGFTGMAMNWKLKAVAQNGPKLAVKIQVPRPSILGVKFHPQNGLFLVGFRPQNFRRLEDWGSLICATKCNKTWTPRSSHRFQLQHGNQSNGTSSKPGSSARCCCKVNKRIIPVSI